MQRLTEQILAHAEGLPEGTPVAAKSVLYLGNRAAVDQALSRLAERGRLIRLAAAFISVPSRAGSARGLHPSNKRSRLSPPAGRDHRLEWSGCRECPRLDDTGAHPVGLSDLGA